MKRTLLLAILLLSIFAVTSAQTDHPLLLQKPTVNRTHIVFSSTDVNEDAFTAGLLWLFGERGEKYIVTRLVARTRPAIYFLRQPCSSLIRR